MLDPANLLSFGLLGAPTGASITPGGVFSWTPTEAQGPGSYSFDVVVTDNGAPNLNDSETITVTVLEVACARTVQSGTTTSTNTPSCNDSSCADVMRRAMEFPLPDLPGSR